MLTEKVPFDIRARRLLIEAGALDTPDPEGSPDRRPGSSQREGARFRWRPRPCSSRTPTSCGWAAKSWLRRNSLQRTEPASSPAHRLEEVHIRGGPWTSPKRIPLRGQSRTVPVRHAVPQCPARELRYRNEVSRLQINSRKAK